MPFLDFNFLKRSRSLENPRVPLSAAYDEIDYAFDSISVTPETAMRVPAFWCGVNFLSSAVASTPLQLFKRVDKGKDKPAAKEVDSSNPLYSLLHDAPNDEWTSFQWRKFAQQSILQRGRSYTFIERDPVGRVRNLWPLQYELVMPRYDKRGRKVYDYQGSTLDGSRSVTYAASDIIDLAYMLKSDGISHYEPTEVLRNTLALALALEGHATNHFRGGGVPDLQLVGPFASPAAADRAVADISSALKRARDNKSKILPLPMGHELKGIGVDPEKSQLTEARRFQITEIARFLGLPPVFLMDLQFGTFSNTEQQDLQLVKHVLTQWFKSWEQELNLKLFSLRNRTGFVEFNVDGLLRGDFRTRMEGYAKAIQNAVLKPNEVRSKENLPPADKGDTLMIQGATVPLGSQPLQPVKDTGKPADDDNPDEGK